MLSYRLLLTGLAPVLTGLAALRLWRGTERIGDLAQRLGRGPGIPGAIWLHGASNGELTSARPLIEALLAGFPDQSMVITANSISGRALVAGWNLPRVTVRLAPVDYRWALATFRTAWRPAALIVLENELWPNRILAMRGPVICVGARMSARSFARWSLVPRLARRILSRIACLAPQDTGSGDRFAALGVPRDRIGPVVTLKSAVDLPTPDPAALDGFAQIFRREATLLAASTHEGEDAILLAALHMVREKRPDLKLILAPRHTRRGDDIAALIDATGLPWARRSKGAAPSAETRIYLADTLGEMALWYALAGVTFVGGSLTPNGGHTPFEPALAGSAILHGPHVANFAEPYGALDAGGGAIVVAQAADIARALDRLADAAAQADLAGRASAILHALRGETDAVTTVVTALRSALNRT